MKGMVWFKDMRRRIKRYCETCHQCQVFKTSNTQPAGLLHPIESREPNERLFIDLIGPLPEGKYGSRYVMVAYDHFTKYVFVKPLVKATSKNIIRRLIKIFSTTGYPKYLVADNAKYFINKQFKIWIANQGIKMKYVSPYHPSSNACERANRTVRTMLTISIDQDYQTDWVEQLPSIELAMRSAINETTGYSPAELYLGRSIKLPIDNILSKIKDQEKIDKEDIKEKKSELENKLES